MADAPTSLIERTRALFRAHIDELEARLAELQAEEKDITRLLLSARAVLQPPDADARRHGYVQRLLLDIASGASGQVRVAVATDRLVAERGISRESAGNRVSRALSVSKEFRMIRRGLWEVVR